MGGKLVRMVDRGTRDLGVGVMRNLRPDAEKIEVPGSVGLVNSLDCYGKTDNTCDAGAETTTH